MGNRRALAAVKANAAYRAANLRAIVDDLRTQGFTSVRAIAAQLAVGLFAALSFPEALIAKESHTEDKWRRS